MRGYKDTGQRGKTIQVFTEYTGKDGICKPRRETAEETNPADTLNFSLQNYGKINVYCLRHPDCGTFLWPPLPNNTLVVGEHCVLFRVISTALLPVKVPQYEHRLDRSKCVIPIVLVLKALISIPTILECKWLKLNSHHHPQIHPFVYKCQGLGHGTHTINITVMNAK